MSDLARLRDHLYIGDAIREIETPPPLVDGLILQGSFVEIYGKWKSGKSFIGLDLSLRLALGMDWHGIQAERCPVLYIVGEGAPGYPDRVEAWLHHHGQKGLPEGFAILATAVNLLDPRIMAEVVAIGLELGAKVVTFDTLARCMPGADENSSRDMGLAVAAIDRARDALGATAAVVHHPGKDASKGGRGSSALAGAIDTELVVSRISNVVTLKVENQRHLPSGDRITFDLTPVGNSLVPICTGGSSSLSSLLPKRFVVMLQALQHDTNGGLTAKEWHETAPGVSRATFHRDMRRMIEGGFVLPCEPTATGNVPRYIPAPSHSLTPKGG